MNNQQPNKFRETIDMPDFHGRGTDRFVFLTHEVGDNEGGMLRILDTFAYFGMSGGIDIISSTTSYESNILPGQEENTEHVYQHVNLSDKEMTKLAKAWLQWEEKDSVPRYGLTGKEEE